MNYTKPNLVLVHSFPTNSIILKGLKEFLEDFFVVYFIDLPGFNKSFDLVKEISVKRYSDFVLTEIQKHKLDSYWLSGVSFGFLVVNSVKVDKNCKGFIAIEPFINNNSLRFTKKIYRFVFQLICSLGLEEKFFNSWLFKKLLTTYSPKGVTKIVLETIHPYTFFNVGLLIFSYTENIKFHDRPYILVINKNDNTIKADEIIALFSSAKNHLIVNTSSDHYPTDLTKEYFIKNIAQAEIQKITAFISQQ